MKQLTREENITALFVIAMYHYWALDDKLNARYALEVAVQFANMPFTLNA